MATLEHTQEDNEARMILTRQATHEISKLAEAVSNICQDDDRPIYHGMMARIQVLTEIIYYSQRLHEETGGDEPDVPALQRVFKGMI